MKIFKEEWYAIRIPLFGYSAHMNGSWSTEEEAIEAIDKRRAIAKERGQEEWTYMITKVTYTREETDDGKFSAMVTTEVAVREY